ncbi:uncharacterized protein CMU_038600 [Cryptosporidium muris RN66]|uniref:Vesicle transport v-SNARE protein n=1 Tax=Cryptosporidium muris (strain RN66) TaxID=441375 RepID=B6A9A2_CRYMR|nr:uncharacterized protein CMU_038600 [Cryptosporidium muris RN66]EEA04793.1 hypothetical protein, conserved [Cryptosporidium muris RN66]|eukprot:XP_002139142.1 hypothetical protein [Cryptosporidium muris RN66]
MYEEDFARYIREIEEIISSNYNIDSYSITIEDSNTELNFENIKKLDRLLEQAQESLNNLKRETEILSNKAPQYQSYQRYVKAFTDINKQCNILKRKIETNSKKKANYQLTNGDSDISNYSITYNLNKYNSSSPTATITNQLISRNNDNLNITTKLAQETHKVGEDSLSTLIIQRDTLTRTKYGLNYTDFNMMESRKLTNNLYRQKLIERLILYIIIIILLVANLYVLIKRIF